MPPGHKCGIGAQLKQTFSSSQGTACCSRRGSANYFCKLLALQFLASLLEVSMIVMNSIMMASKNLEFKNHWPYHSFNLVSFGSLVLGFTILFIRWRVIVIGTFFFVLSELSLFGICAFLTYPVLHGAEGSYVIALTSRGSALAQETLLDIMVLMMLRLLIYFVQLFIMCYKLARLKSLDNVESNGEEMEEDNH